MKYEQMSYKQLSIYDFLPEEKSQEVAPSETLPQVDEAQESEKLPSSALDAKESMEDTDSTLFSVGDTVKVRKADEIYTLDTDPESFHYLSTFKQSKGTVSEVNDKFLRVDGLPFYFKEVIKI